MTTKEIIACAEKRGFHLSHDDAMDIIVGWARSGESVEKAVCGWLLTYETCDPDLEIRFGLPANLFS